MSALSWNDLGYALLAATAYGVFVILVALYLNVEDDWIMEELPWLLRIVLWFARTTDSLWLKHPNRCEDNPGPPVPDRRSMVVVNCEDPS